MAKLKGPAPGEWEYTIGEPPVMLTAHERAERGNVIVTRIWTGKRYRERNRALCDSIRDERGRIVPQLETEARKLADERHEELLAGVEREDRKKGPLSLPRGFRLLLDPKEGKFAGKSKYRREVERDFEVIREALLGASGTLLLRDLKHTHYRKLWRWIAHQHHDAGRFGPRRAEVIVGTLQMAVRWLQEEGHLEPGTGQPAPHWKQVLKREWTQITGKQVTEPRKLRHSGGEIEKLWAALPKADPRLALAMQIGAELRLGQVPRSKRTDALPHLDHAIGKVVVHGAGKKLGGTVILTDDERAAIETAMATGYLSGLEAAYRAGEIHDYYLITGGRLRKGKAQLKNADRALGESGLHGAFVELELLAGVEPMKGRKWYGVRRKQADRAEDHTSDARVLNRMGNWSHTATREGYQEKGREDIAEETARVRSRIRPKPQQDNDLSAPEEGGEG